MNAIVVPGALSSGVNWHGHEAGQSPPSITEAKNKINYILSLSHAFMECRGIILPA